MLRSVSHTSHAAEKKEFNMAKKKVRNSLSQKIRDHLQANPGATPNQIVEALANQGIKVSPGLASNVKYTSGPGAKKKAAKKKRANGRRKGTKRTVMRRRPGAQTVDIATLQAAAKFLATVGDAETATAAIKQVKSLQID
jgi:hypothetical protein